MAVIDPEGRFDTNNLDEIKALSWVFPDEPLRALPPEIFMRDYYETKLLTKALNQQTVRSIVSLSRLNRAQPGVKLVKVEPEPGQSLVSVTLSVTNTQSKAQKDQAGKYLESGAFDLRLFRDGQLVGQWPEASESAERSFARAG